MKKIMYIIVVVLLFIIVAEQVGTNAANISYACKTVGYITPINTSKITGNDTRLIYFDNNAMLNTHLTDANIPFSYRKNTATPTAAPKKSSEKKEEGDDGYGLGGFIVLVILAIGYFKSEKKKNTINVRVKK